MEEAHPTGLASLLFGEYPFTAMLEDDAVLPPYKGSTFRGVFGQALKEFPCALRLRMCLTSWLHRQGVYFHFFEFPPEMSLPGRPPPAHPIVIEPPLDFRTHLSAGEHLHIFLLYFVEASLCLPYFVYALEQMGRIGIGDQVFGRQARFKLLFVSTPAQEVVDHYQDGNLRPVRPAPVPVESFATGFPSKALTFELITPLRLKFLNPLQAELPSACNTLGQPVAAGVLHPRFGILPSPVIGAAAMNLGSGSVVGTALGLRRLSL